MYANWLFDEMKNARLQPVVSTVESKSYIKQPRDDQLPTPNSQLTTHNIFREYRTVLSLNPSRINEVLEKFMSITHDYSELKRLLIDNPENHYKLAVFLQEKGYWHQSIPAFLDDMERTRTKIFNSQIPSIFPYYKALASGLMKDNQKKKAIELLREYIKSEEELDIDDYKSPNSHPQSKIQNSKSSNHYDLAKAHFWVADWAFYGGKKYGYGWNFVKYHHLKALELDPENNLYRLWYAIHLIYKNEYRTALGHLDVILKENPEHADAHFRLGQCYEGLSNLDIALRQYKKAISLAPDNEEYMEHYNNLKSLGNSKTY
ncbi:MAG: hypothetical protein SCARUB_02081 [Candidatus Scalindua rubra]|uniref:Uncharacterized protein n=1 Tax=Candidatus Scalindua rubra TaxID=1872076 RepID=A0A1E3XAU6_9BACT|nr:MAG: hypothetical protein SCARUB_02081 [Candidatus Scalindua rubra]